MVDSEPMLKLIKVKRLSIKKKKLLEKQESNSVSDVKAPTSTIDSTPKLFKVQTIKSLQVPIIEGHKQHKL